RFDFENRSLWNDAVHHVTPQGDEQLASQGDDHDFSDPPSSRCADTRAEPHGQGTARLPAQPGPGEFDHRRAHPSVAVFADPLFAFAAAAGERRPAKADVSGERASIAKRPHERLTDEKRSGVRTDGPQGRQRTDLPFRFIRRRVLLQNGVARRLHLINQFQDEIESIEQTFDALFRLLRDRVAARLARAAHCSRRSRRKALYPLMPSVAKMPSILLTIDRRSLVKSSRSRFARRASSSASLGIGTIEQTRGSPLSQAIKVRSNISTSILSVLARRARQSTGRLEGCMTCTSIPCRARKRASQNPSRPASWVRITRATFRPADAHLAFRRSTKETKLSPQASSACLECRSTPGS